MLDLKINKLGQWEGSSIKFLKHLTWKSETFHLGWASTNTALFLHSPTQMYKIQYFLGMFPCSLKPHMVKSIHVNPKESSALKVWSSSGLNDSIPASAINKPYNLRQISQLSWAIDFLC